MKTTLPCAFLYSDSFFFFLRLRFKCFPLVISSLTWYKKLSSLHTCYVPCVTVKIREKCTWESKKTGLLFEKKNNSVDCTDNFNKTCCVKQHWAEIGIVAEGSPSVGFHRAPRELAGALALGRQGARVLSQLPSHGLCHHSIRTAQCS